MQDLIKAMDFDSIRLRIASPEVIHSWSHGEITRPETINYRTQKPEKDGLFCEKIFGPSKDWECYCGKYKKIRYKGIVCDKCGVEVTRSIVRRERMGHIDLSAPVSHIWFLRSVPSKIGTLLGLSPMILEKVIYFANFIVIDVDHELKAVAHEELKQEFKEKKKKISKDFQGKAQEIKALLKDDKREKELLKLAKEKEEAVKELEELFSSSEKELKDLSELKILTEMQYQDLSFKYGHLFEAGIGAEAVRKLLEKINVEKETERVKSEIKTAKGIKKEKMAKQLKLLENIKKNDVKPEWMIFTVVPVIPPDLRPMVALDGGRFATSDLNDLYRRVINRNNRLKQLNKLNAPEVICRNEKRMLQEAVDALIDNSARHGKTVVASTGQKRMLKSIADILKGKQGRFRQNLLGKRVDYSGRSVIVIGPHLKLNECGLPKKMALELFKPFVISRLIKDGVIHNVRSAIRFINEGRPEVWDILEDVISHSYVLLNRAPTLHRLGIQAFRPMLIEGKAIQIHPMVCSAFNADFDGDQMAVHVPLTEEAQREARDIMQSSKNLLKPATGDPVVTPNQDIVWGCYYMTSLEKELTEEQEKKIKTFANENRAIYAFNARKIKLRELIRVRTPRKTKDSEGGGIIKTTVGRVLFNQALPEDHLYVNEKQDAGSLKRMVKMILGNYGLEVAVKFVDSLKTSGFRHITDSGLSWGMGDLPELKEKEAILKEADKVVENIKEQYNAGLLTEGERHSKIIEVWTMVKDKIVSMAKDAISTKGSIYTIIDSKAKGHWGQLTQVVGMKGLVSSPSGDIIELPVKGNFKEGFDVLEFFISTHGSRKGLSDTALRTANAGYLTRRLVDVVQDVFIAEENCGDSHGYEMTKEESERLGQSLGDRLLGRTVLENIINPKTKEVITKKGGIVGEEEKDKIKEIDLERVKIRSVLSCKSKKGVCQKCYGWDLGFNKPVKFGATVGIVAAQSIGEPGTQLTMRTFHTGGVAGADITQGLPRVEELFEVRNPKSKAILADEDGRVKIEQQQRTIKDATGKVILENVPGQKVLKLEYEEIEEEKYEFVNPKAKGENPPAGGEKVVVKIKDGDRVNEGDILFLRGRSKVKAKKDGEARILTNDIIVSSNVQKVKEFLIPKGFDIWTKDGEMVTKGQQLTEGSLDLQQLFKLAGKLETQKYIINEIQYLYSSQGQPLNDKHVEVIARQMFSKVSIKSDGDTNFSVGSVIDMTELDEENKKIEKAGGAKARGEELLLGITKVSLSTKSFLSAASFQETSKILIEAAVSGKIDNLEGLKENVIIGRLIPAGTGYKAGEKETKK